jgi:hypothetical protein
VHAPSFTGAIECLLTHAQHLATAPLRSRPLAAHILIPHLACSSAHVAASCMWQWLCVVICVHTAVAVAGQQRASSSADAAVYTCHRACSQPMWQCLGSSAHAAVRMCQHIGVTAAVRMQQCTCTSEHSTVLRSPCDSAWAAVHLQQCTCDSAIAAAAVQLRRLLVTCMLKDHPQLLQQCPFGSLCACDSAAGARLDCCCARALLYMPTSKS